MQVKEFSFKQKKYKVNLRDQSDQSVWAEIFQWQEYRQIEKIIAQAQDPLIDAGSQAGFFILYVRALNDKIKVYAIEPAADNVAALVEHIKINHLQNIKIFTQALAAKTGKRTLYLSADHHDHSLLNYNAKKAREETIVSTISLNDFLNSRKITHISLLKMDIEGAEYEVLTALSADNWAKLAAIYLEYHDYQEFNHQQLVKLIQKQGFKVKIFPSSFDNKLGFILATK